MLIQRIGIVGIALGILFWRTPTTFTNPQFWGEDADFFAFSRALGWASLKMSMAGYLVTTQFLVANLANYFSPIAAPAIYNYAAVFLTLVVVWLVTSPRLDMPFKSLLAFAVIVVPLAYEEVGTITNIQWILPIGAFAILFMRTEGSSATTTFEAAFLAIESITGPFSIFLMPLFVGRLFMLRNGAQKNRLLILTFILCLGAFTQLIVISLNPSATNGTPPAPYSWTLWVSLLPSNIMTIFHFSPSWFEGISGFGLSLLILTTMLLLALRKPYRTQKMAMLFISGAIAWGGMYKFRANLGQFAAERYFYIASVFSLWFVCCVFSARYMRWLCAGFVLLIEISFLSAIANTSRTAGDLQWSAWARHIDSGLPIIIPTSPTGFHILIPAAPVGRLSHYSAWIGRSLGSVASASINRTCRGSIGLIEPVQVTNPPANSDLTKLWGAEGTAIEVSSNESPQIVALVDADSGIVVGFGLPNFQPPFAFFETKSSAGWKAIFRSETARTIRAYGIFDDGQMMCAFGGDRHFPATVEHLASENFSFPATLLPNVKVTQRFKPVRSIEGLKVILVAYNRTPSRYPIAWNVSASKNGHSTIVGSGIVDSSLIRGWQAIELPIRFQSDEVADEIEISLWAETDTQPRFPIGIPLYKPSNTEGAPSTEIGGIAVQPEARIGLIVSYSP